MSTCELLLSPGTSCTKIFEDKQIVIVLAGKKAFHDPLAIFVPSAGEVGGAHLWRNGSGEWFGRGGRKKFFFERKGLK